MASVLSTRQFQRDYSLSRKIGHGAFGEIYIGKSVRTGKPVAVKKEPINTKFPQLLYEAKVYSILEGGMGIPRVYMKGSMGDNNIMVMDLLGPSLEDLFNYCGRRFTLKTTMMLGIELITRLEFIHHRNFIHRDIKPDNFVIGIGERANVVYIIDFGLSKQYRDPYHTKHIPYVSLAVVMNSYRENKNLTGTPRYASLSNHLGIEQSRRDDLESLGYVLLYFIRGKLPWQGLNAQTKKQKYNKIMESKIEVVPSALPSSLELLRVPLRGLATPAAGLHELLPQPGLRREAQLPVPPQPLPLRTGDAPPRQRRSLRLDGCLHPQEPLAPAGARARQRWGPAAGSVSAGQRAVPRVVQGG